MTHKYTIVKHMCPKCKKVYERYGDHGKSLTQKYASPIIICPNCKWVFTDESHKEIAISGIDNYDKQMFSKADIVVYSIMTISGLLISSLLSKFLGAILLVGVFVTALYTLISYKPKMNKLKKLEQESIDRLNNKDYVIALLKFGISVPEEYLKKHNVDVSINAVLKGNKETQKFKPKTEIDLKKMIDDRKLKDDKHRCLSCGNIQSKSIQRCLKCSNLIPEDAPRMNSAELDSLMTGQLVALYKTTHNQEYSNEYERRLKHIGFLEKEVKSLFMLELMMLKHDHIPVLTDKSYLINNYFNLKTPIFSLENTYYVEHQIFLLSEITKIWDEAEWIWTYRRDEITSADALNEIFKITRYGGGELLIETLKSISKHSNIDLAKIQKYSVCEQNMLFKYKWYKNKNEKHPYY